MKNPDRNKATNQQQVVHCQQHIDTQRIDRNHTGFGTPELAPFDRSEWTFKAPKCVVLRILEIQRAPKRTASRCDIVRDSGAQRLRDSEHRKDGVNESMISLICSSSESALRFRAHKTECKLCNGQSVHIDLTLRAHPDKPHWNIFVVIMDGTDSVEQFWVWFLNIALHQFDKYQHIIYRDDSLFNLGPTPWTRYISNYNKYIIDEREGIESVGTEGKRMRTVSIHQFVNGEAQRLQCDHKGTNDQSIDKGMDTVIIEMDHQWGDKQYDNEMGNVQQQ